MELKIYRPDGSYKMEATLTDAELEAYQAWPISFHLPVMPKRIIHKSPAYVVVATIETGTELRGMFIDGNWISDVYSNGIEEDKNPTRIGDFEEQLKASICMAIKLAVNAHAIGKR